MAKEDKVEQYFFLDKRIKKTYERIRTFKEKFNNSNFYTGMQERNGEVTTVAFNVEYEVIRYVTAIQKAEQHIEVMKFKQKHFQRFLQGLTHVERDYLIRRYKWQEETVNDRLDALVKEEITEIEEAVSYRFYDETPEQRIVFNPFEDEGNFEDSFSQMLELLGV